MEKEDIFDKLMHLPGLRIFEPIYKKYKEILMYLLFGFLTFVVSMTSFTVFNVVMQLNEHIANIFSWILAVLFAFITNRIWVFNAPTNTNVEFVRQMLSFFGGRILTLVIEEIIIFIFITKLEFDSVIVKLIAQIIVIVMNYVVSKLFVFKNNHAS